MKRRRQQVTPGAAGWDVVVATATKQTYTGDRYGQDYYDRRYRDRYDQLTDHVEGKVAVRLTYNGVPTMTFGVLAISTETFGEDVLTMKAAAQERASELNAAGAVGS